MPHTPAKHRNRPERVSSRPPPGRWWAKTRRMGPVLAGPVGLEERWLRSERAAHRANHCTQRFTTTGPSGTVTPPTGAAHTQANPQHASSGWGAAPLGLGDLRFMVE
jgi:hypothetical protein